MGIEVQYWTTLITGLSYHYIKVLYFNWGYPELGEPSWLSWLLLFSVLHIIAYFKIQIVRFRRGRPSSHINNIAAAVIALFVTNLLMDEIWVTLICRNSLRYYGELIDFIRNTALGRTSTGLKLLNWLKMDAYREACTLLVALVFIGMAKFTDLWGSICKQIDVMFEEPPKRGRSNNRRRSTVRR